MSLSIIEKISYHCKYKIRKLIKTFQCPIDDCNATYLGYTACRLELSESTAT